MMRGLVVQMGDAAELPCTSWPCCGHSCQGGRGASKSFQMVFILSGLGMLIFILFGLVAAQTSGMDSMRSHQSRKARLKEIAIYVCNRSKQTNQAFL